MIRRLVSETRSTLRRLLTRRRDVGTAVATVVLLVIGTRIIAPGIDGNALAEFLRSGGGGPLVGLYDWLVGGAMTRGALLAIGIVPFLTAKIYLRLARLAFPRFEARLHDDPGGVRLTRWTRRLTFAFALVQSYGFARFLQQVPGVVTDPGIAFTLQTVGILTAGAMGIAWLSERFAAAVDPDSLRSPNTSPRFRKANASSQAEVQTSQVLSQGRIALWKGSADRLRADMDLAKRSLAAR